MRKSKKSLLLNANPFFLAAFSLLLAFAGQYFLYTQKSLIAGLILFFIAACLFILAGRDKPEPACEIDGRIEAVIFVFIMLVAVFFRFYRINEVPAGCFVDEAQNVFDAVDIINGNLPVYFGFSTHNAALFLYPAAFIFKLFGEDVTQLRAVSAIFGVLTVPAVYFLFRAALGVRSAIIAGFILAVLRWHVNFNRIGYHASFALLLFVLVLYFTYKAWKEKTWPNFILLGLCLGISQNTYQSARLIPFWLIFVSFFIFLKDRGFFSKNIRKIAVTLCLAIVISLPIIGYAMKNPDVFFQRQKEVNIFTAGIIEMSYQNEAKLKPVPLMLRNVKDTLLMFNYKGDKNPKHNIPGHPVLDFALGTFVFIGFILALTRFYRPVYFMFLSIFAVFIVSGFITIEAPQSLRLFFLIPSVIFFAVIFLTGFMGLAETAAKTAGEKNLSGTFAAVIVITLLLFSGADNFNSYFNIQAKNPYCWNDFATDAWLTGRYYKDKGPGWKPIVAVENYKERTFTLAAGLSSRNRALKFKIDESVPVPFVDGLNYVYILTPQYNSLVQGLFIIMYPNGRYVPFYNKYDPNWKLYYAYEVDAKEAKSARSKFKNNGLLLKRYIKKEWQGEAYSEKTTPVVMLDYDYGELSYEWTGKIRITKKGVHVFIFDTKGFADLYIDKKRVLEAPGSEKGVNPVEAKVFLTEGYHSIKVRYSQELTFAKMELRWIEPGEKEYLVPFDALFH